MRRSRYVAREFAHEKRLDTFSPATGAHTSNLLPMKYLGMKEAIKRDQFLFTFKDVHTSSNAIFQVNVLEPNSGTSI